MQAIVMRERGGPEVLHLESVPVPEPGAGQVRIRIHAAAVNPIDWKLRERWTPTADRPFRILGFDAAGTIDALGAGVRVFRRGEVVFAALQRAPQGAYAPYAVVPADDVAAAPRTTDLVAAASLVTGGVTALRAIAAVGVRPGQTVLVQGGAGGVGTPLVQILKARGASVVATASGRNVEYLRSLGVDRVIDYTAAPFETQVKDVDVVIDTVGGDTTTRSVATLKAGGALVSIAGDADPPTCARARVRCVEYPDSDAPFGAELKELAALVDAGKLTTYVEKTFPLSDAAAAQQLNQTGRTRGKIVLEVP
jgi:NADPH:quinone reductase-like Zn-dependent oxidoreductase